VEKVYKKAFEKGVVLFTGNGCADGVDGDLIMISPPFVITEGQIDQVVDVLKESFKEMDREVRT
jgi:adenosylmethionine-8-amino-7-oxononanoate aminotransferase